MKMFIPLLKFIFLLVFSSTSLLADAAIVSPSPGKEVLEDQDGPPPGPAALIDLNKNNNQQKKEPTYSGMYLFLFNIVMFTTGMVVVKNITGKKP